MINLIINFTPTGMIPTKEMTPHVPISPVEIVAEVEEAHALGITIVHLHARDFYGKSTYHKEVYAEIIGEIRKFAPELVICVSLSGRDFSEFEQRSEVLELEGDLKPDMGSLTLSSLNFPRQASVNSPDIVQQLASKMLWKGIVPELEAFDVGMVNYAKYLLRKDFLIPPCYINLLVGNVSGAQFDPMHIGSMIHDLPEDTFWSLAGIGNTQLRANVFGIIHDGGVRVGLEDNIYLDADRKVLAKNKDMLTRIHEIAKLYERDVMPSSEFRMMMDMNRGNGEYGRDSIAT